MVITGVILILVGFWLTVSPKSFFRFETKEVKIFKEKLVRGKDTLKIYRYVGLAFLAVGLALVLFF